MLFFLSGYVSDILEDARVLKIMYAVRKFKMYACSRAINLLSQAKQ
jgi:hypothetical protein